MPSPIIILVSIIFAAGGAYTYLYIGAREKNLPHGPPTIPILGNLHLMPTKGAHLKFTEWAQQYGGMFSLKLGTGTAIVLTDRHLVKELLDRKSSISSNRPQSYLNDLVSGSCHMLVMHYGSLWRTFRKVSHQHFMETVVENEYVKIQDAEAVQMMYDYTVAPEQHMKHPKRYSNSIVMSIIYGFRTPNCSESHMTRLYDVLDNLSEINEVGNTPPVDIYPFLHWIPERFLGMWVTRAKHLYHLENSLFNDLLDTVEKRREKEGSKGSFMDRIFEQQDKLGLSRHEMAYLAGTMLEGGSDTSSAIILAFVHAMTKWPEVQKKAQKEIDAIMGEDRSPVWEDYANLPYVAATVKEANRWRPVVPLAFPHCLAEDDWIDGKFLPKGSMIMLNTWGLHHDEKKFPNHDTFDPDHFRGQTELAPTLFAGADPEARDHYGYGSGRRICPGIHLAERNLFLGIAKLLWAFEIAPGKDESGNIIEPDVDAATAYSTGFLICAKPYALEIKPRSEARRATIMREQKAVEQSIFSQYQKS